MKKFLKIIAVLVAIPVVLFAVAAVVLVTLDLNDYKEDIAQLVNEQTGRQLSVNGELGKSFFPWLGVKVGDVALSNAAGFGDKAFVAVKRVEVKIDTLSLLKMQPAIDQVILHGLQLNLARNKQGKTNWEDLAGGTGDTQAPATQAESMASTATEEDKAAQQKLLAAITVGGIDIKDANVSWSDAQANAGYAVNNLDLSISEIAYEKPLSLSLSMDLLSENPPMKSHVELDSKRIEWDLDKQLYQLKPLALKVNAQGEAIGPQPVELALNAHIKADLAQEQLAITALTLNTMGIKVSGDTQVNALLSNPKFNSSMKVAAFNPRDMLGKLNIELPPMAGSKALTQVMVDMDVNGDTSNINVQQLNIKLDETNIKTQASVKNLARPAIEFDVAMDKINLDNYLPPKVEGETAVKSEQPAPAAAGPEQPLPVPVEMLRTLNVVGQLVVKQLTVMQLASTDVTVGVKAKGGKVNIKPLSLNVADGAINSAIALDVTGKVPVYAVQQTIKSVKAAPLAKAVMGEDMVSGTLNSTVDVTTKGLLVSEIKKQLNGNVKFSFENGAVKGFNLGDIIRTVTAKIKGGDYKSGDAELTTDFAVLTGTAQIANGIVTNKDLSAKSPLLRVSGDGKVDLTKDYLNYLATSYVVGTSKGQEGKDIDELKGLPIPIRLKGTFDNLDYEVDYGTITKAYKDKYKKKIADKKEEVKKQVAEKKEEVKQEAKKEFEEEKKKAVKKAEDKLKDQFKKLF